MKTIDEFENNRTPLTVAVVLGDFLVEHYSDRMYDDGSIRMDESNRITVRGVTALGTDFIVATPEEKYMEVAGTRPAQVTFRCDGHTFVTLAYGRLTPAAALAAGTLTAEGNSVWAEVFVQGYIGG